MINFIGILGSLLLAFCGLPQAINSIKTKSSIGISTLFLLMWGVGEIFILIYVLCTSMDLILILNYVFNLLLIGIIGYYKIK